MKIHVPRPPLEVVRITFRKKGYKFCYCILEDTTVDELKSYLETNIPKLIDNDIFYRGDSIGMDIRSYCGSKAGESKSISFKHSITPEQLKELIVKLIEKHV